MKILVINGPNLNMLGKREARHYGVKTLGEIEKLVGAVAQNLRVEVEFFQSNHEGSIVDHIQKTAVDAGGIIINPGALTHYGLSLLDALIDSGLPVVEVHLSNIYAREEFRHHSVISPATLGQVAGLGWLGYILALESLCNHLGEGS